MNGLDNFRNIYEIVQEVEEEIEEEIITEFYCAACDKTFRTEKQYANTFSNCLMLISS